MVRTTARATRRSHQGIALLAAAILAVLLGIQSIWGGVGQPWPTGATGFGTHFRYLKTQRTLDGLTPQYKLGETVAFRAELDFSASEVVEVTAPTLRITGPQPLDVILPTNAGMNQDRTSSLPMDTDNTRLGTLSVDVIHNNVTPGGGGGGTVLASGTGHPSTSSLSRRPTPARPTPPLSPSRSPASAQALRSSSRHPTC